MSVRSVVRAAFVVCSLSACANDSAPEDLASAPVNAGLHGKSEYKGDACTPEKQAVVDEALRWGRIASASAAFEGCIASSVNGTGALGIGAYRKCKGDPWYDEDAETQIRKAVAMSRSKNDVIMTCDGVPGPGEDFVARAGFGDYGRTDPESFQFNSAWLASVVGNLGQPLCSTVDPGTPCRWAAYPWPNGDIAERIWHEASHTHGYTHGANEQEKAIKNCGYEGDATWHFQSNTMPYIIGQCISRVLGRSNDVCGDPGDGCGSAALKMVSDVDSTSCVCVKDPRLPRKSLGRGAPEPEQTFDYQTFSLHTGTPLHETGGSFDFVMASNGDLFAISKSGTGTGTTELHVLSAESGYQEFSLHTGTALHETGDSFEFGLTRDRDLVAISKSGTGSGTTEVHILSAASGYQEFSLHTGTALQETGDNFEFEVAGGGDLYAIAKSSTGSGMTEVHILTAASNYQEFAFHGATGLQETGGSFQFLLSSNYDLIALSKSGTGTGSTEVHILSNESGYREFSMHTGTPLHETGDSFDFVVAPNRDIVAISKSGTGTGSTELHVLAH